MEYKKRIQTLFVSLFFWLFFTLKMIDIVRRSAINLIGNLNDDGLQLIDYENFGDFVCSQVWFKIKVKHFDVHATAAFVSADEYCYMFIYFVFRLMFPLFAFI